MKLKNILLIMIFIPLLSGCSNLVRTGLIFLINEEQPKETLDNSKIYKPV